MLWAHLLKPITDQTTDVQSNWQLLQELFEQLKLEEKYTKSNEELIKDYNLLAPLINLLIAMLRQDYDNLLRKHIDTVKLLSEVN